MQAAGMVRMRAIVVTNFDAWDFPTMREAREWAKTLIEYSQTHGTDGFYPDGGGAEWVEVWAKSEWEDEDGIWDMRWVSPEACA